MDIARRPEEYSNEEDNAWGEAESPPAAAPQRAPEGRASHSELGGGAPCPSAAGLSVREDDGPRGGGARKWALRGGTLQLRQRLNRTLSKKVNRARGEPVKHCGESRKEERRAGEDRVHPGDTGVSGVGALGRAAVVGNDAPRALTSAKPLSLLVPGAAADCGEAWGLPGSRENRR